MAIAALRRRGAEPHERTCRRGSHTLDQGGRTASSRRTWCRRQRHAERLRRRPPPRPPPLHCRRRTCPWRSLRPRRRRMKARGSSGSPQVSGGGSSDRGTGGELIRPRASSSGAARPGSGGDSGVQDDIEQLGDEGGETRTRRSFRPPTAVAPDCRIRSAARQRSSRARSSIGRRRT